MPKSSDADNVNFLLHCLSSAIDNGGKPDFKTIGAKYYNDATPNALYLRLGRLKKSVSFTETKTKTAADDDNDDDASPPAPTAKPYAPTAKLPPMPARAKPKPKPKPKRATSATTVGKGGQKRKTGGGEKGDGGVGTSGDGDDEESGEVDSKRVKVEEEESGGEGVEGEKGKKRGGKQAWNGFQAAIAEEDEGEDGVA